MPKRPQARSAGSAAAGSDAGAKTAKPHVCVSSHAITIPFNKEPESPKLSANAASRRAARKADENATSEETYSRDNYGTFAERFQAAVASAFAQWRRPVTLTEVIIAMTDMTGKVKIKKQLKDRFAWNGFKEDRWMISRAGGGGPGGGKGLVAYPKDAAMPSRSGDWRFSPSPAARRPVLRTLP